MDEMKIQSKFMTGLVSRIVKKVLRTKLGCEVDIQLNEFRTTVIDDKTHVHLDLDADLTKEELNKLLESEKLSRFYAALFFFRRFCISYYGETVSSVVERFTKPVKR